MRNFVLSLAGVGLSVLVAGTAHATVFAGSANFVDQANGNALSVSAYPNPATFTTSLTAGQSDYMTGFMLLKTTDTQACFLGCTNTDPISLTFTWTLPTPANGPSANGTVSETTFLIAAFDSGQLKWAGDTNGNPGTGYYAKQFATFTDGAEAEIDLYDTYLVGTSSSEGAQFDVRIKDIKDPIPEPMSVGLFGLGMAGIGFVRRRRAQQHIA